MPHRSANNRRRSLAGVLRWTGRGAVLLAVIFGLLTLPLACTTRIIPPAAPRDPVTVILVDHGDTPSLVLPAGNASMVRYAYGDWQWYALGNRGYLRAIPTLAFPTQGALGRQEMAGSITEAAVKEQMRIGFERLHSVQVPREQVRQLRTRLDALFQHNRRSRVFNRGSDLHFVHHHRRYTYFFNSNHMLAAWLEELGCKTDGPAYASRWRVETQR